MILTKEEAKTKWCPETRTGLTAGMAVNHHVAGDVHDETRCIGPGCMMWRWGKVINVYKPCDPETNNGAGFIMHEELGGYCGRAGIPVQVGMASKP